MILEKIEDSRTVWEIEKKSLSEADYTRAETPLEAARDPEVIMVTTVLNGYHKENERLVTTIVAGSDGWRFGMGLVGIVLSILAARHFTMEGRFVYVVPSVLVALFFLFDIAVRWEERRRNVGSVRRDDLTAPGRYRPDHFLARRLRRVR